MGPTTPTVSPTAPTEQRRRRRLLTQAEGCGSRAHGGCRRPITASRTPASAMAAAASLRCRLPRLRTRSHQTAPTGMCYPPRRRSACGQVGTFPRRLGPARQLRAVPHLRRTPRAGAYLLFHYLSQTEHSAALVGSRVLECAARRLPCAYHVAHAAKRTPARCTLASAGWALGWASRGSSLGAPARRRSVSPILQRTTRGSSRWRNM